MPPMTLIAVGDIMLGDQALRLGSGVGSVIRRRRPDFIFQRVRSTLTGADVVFGNLETVLSDESFDPRSFLSRVVRGAPAAAPALRRAGFNVLSVANNHVFDHGLAAYRDTLDRLRSAGIQPVGLVSDGRPLPLTFDCRGIRVAFLGYSWSVAAASTAKEKETGILADIRSAKSAADVLCLSLHWGHEYMDFPSPEQIRFARAAVEAGATCVLGHHPHCVQGMERHRGGLICYSLGNFVFDFAQSGLRSSILVRIEWDGEAVGTVATVPIRINRLYQPRSAEGTRFGRRTLRRLADLSEGISRYARMPMAHYLEEVRKRQGAARRRNRLHFALNLWRYPRRFIVPALRTLPASRGF